MIYLDNAATTKPYPEVVTEVLPYLINAYGNPGSLHPLGIEAKKAVEHAREQVAKYIGAKPNQIFFTSGGTEANNMVFSMLAGYLKASELMVLTTRIEHESTLKAINRLKYKYGIGVRYLDVHMDGTVTYDKEIEQLIRDGKIGLLSMMAVNNETGFCLADDLQFKRLKLMSPNESMLVHTDCVQAAGYENIDVDWLGCDFMSISAHKIHGLKGAGCLYVRRNSPILDPLILGGLDQERGLRGGTENVPGIVAFGKACEILSDDSNRCAEENWISLNNLSDSFRCDLERRLKANGVAYTINSNTNKIINVRFDGVDAQTLVLMLASKGVCVSAGSACRSQESEPSYVLQALGLTADQARQSIRVSFSADNTQEELSEAAKIITECVVSLLGKGEGDT